MSDSVGNPIFSKYFSGSSDDMRDMFVSQMKNLSDTIKNSSSSPLIISMLAPYLSMMGANSLIKRLNSDSIVSILDEAADCADKCKDGQSGVIVAYLTNSKMGLFAFDFKDGTAKNMDKDMSLSGDSLGEEIFISISIKKELENAAKELNMIPLLKSSSILCGVTIE